MGHASLRPNQTRSNYTRCVKIPLLSFFHVNAVPSMPTDLTDFVLDMIVAEREREGHTHQDKGGV